MEIPTREMIGVFSDLMAMPNPEGDGGGHHLYIVDGHIIHGPGPAESVGWPDERSARRVVSALSLLHGAVLIGGAAAHLKEPQAQKVTAFAAALIDGVCGTVPFRILVRWLLRRLPPPPPPPWALRIERALHYASLGDFDGQILDGHSERVLKAALEQGHAKLREAMSGLRE